MKLNLGHGMTHSSPWQVVSEAEEGLPKRIYGKPPPALHNDESAWSEPTSLCAEKERCR